MRVIDHLRVTWMTCHVTLLLLYDVAALAFLDRFLGDDCPHAYFVFLLILSCFGSLHYTVY